MGVPETISPVPKSPVSESREVAEVIKVQNEDELRLAQMGECICVFKAEVQAWVLMLMATQVINRS